jgi:hypothetical protein
MLESLKNSLKEMEFAREDMNISKLKLDKSKINLD